MRRGWHGAGSVAAAAAVSTEPGALVQCTKAYPARPPVKVVFNPQIQSTLLGALDQARGSVTAALFTLDNSYYGRALQQLRERTPRVSVRI